MNALWHLSENLQWECTHLFSSCYQCLATSLELDWLPKQSGCWWETHSLCMVFWSVIIAWLVPYILSIYTNLHWLNMIYIYIYNAYLIHHRDRVQIVFICHGSHGTPSTLHSLFLTPARRASWWLSIRFLWRWLTIVGETPFSCFFPTNLKKPFQTALGDAIKIISDMPKCLVIFVFLKIAKLANFEWCDQLSLSFTWFLEERFDGFASWFTMC